MNEQKSKSVPTESTHLVINSEQQNFQFGGGTSDFSIAENQHEVTGFSLEIEKLEVKLNKLNYNQRVDEIGEKIWKSKDWLDGEEKYLRPS